jgi:hypothetical protein
MRDVRPGVFDWKEIAETLHLTVGSGPIHVLAEIKRSGSAKKTPSREVVSQEKRTLATQRFRKPGSSR